jgi:hypothetical protein
MLVRHELAEIGAVESPGIDHQFAMDIDDGDGLAGEDKGGLTAPRWNFDK